MIAMTSLGKWFVFFVTYGTIEVAYIHTRELIALFALDKINLQGMLLALGVYFP